MKYLLILQTTADLPTRDHDRFRRTAEQAGELVGGHTLADPSTARLLGDGPVSSVHGYYLVDVETADRAVDLARLLPESRTPGSVVEVRPVMYAAVSDY